MQEKDYAREYGNRCRQIRQAKGISQQVLADKMHTTPQSVSKWEREGITNVNTVMQLSEVLGQDITADQIDQEGTVGEIGQEILAILVRNKGYVEFDDLVDKLFGMSAERVAGELFKLERIGNIIREQYVDYCNNSRDGVFITAKGMVTIKNIKIFGFSDEVLSECTSYEAALYDWENEKEHRNFQDKMEGDHLSKLIWNIPHGKSYRVDYILYLIGNFRDALPGGSLGKGPKVEQYMEPVKTGKNAFVDILYRMALGIDNSYYTDLDTMEEEYAFYDLDADRDELHRELMGFDDASFEAQVFFEKRFSWIIHDDTTLTDKDKWIFEENVPPEKKDVYERYKKINEKYWEELGRDLDIVDREYFKDLFHDHVSQEREERCLEWFDYTDVENFLRENYLPASTEREKEIDRIIGEIHEKYPETLDYFYHFPKEWEDNGLAQMVRDVWNVPIKSV